MEARLVRPDSSHCDVLVSAAPLNNAEGELVGAVASLLDIPSANAREGESRPTARSRRTQRGRRRSHATYTTSYSRTSGALQSLRLTNLRARNSGLELDLEEELEALGRASSGLRNAMYDLGREGRPFLESVESLVELNRQLAPEREVVLTIKRFPGRAPRKDGRGTASCPARSPPNARRHSGQGRGVAEDGGRGRIGGVLDDGRGFDPSSTRAGGALGDARGSRLGGEIEIASPPGGGR